MDYFSTLEVQAYFVDIDIDFNNYNSDEGYILPYLRKSHKIEGLSLTSSQFIKMEVQKNVA